MRATTRLLAGAWLESHTQAFHRDGIVCVENFLDHATVDLLKKEMETLIGKESARRASAAEATAFDPKNPDKHSADRYFIESAGKVHFFLEPGQAEVSVATVNKVGHALHTDGSVFQQFTAQPIFGSIARRLGRAHPSVIQSMYILKAPNIGGEVSPHQDSTWIHTTPLSCLGIWFALDDCTIDNGCLLACKGSQWRPLTARCLTNHDSDSSTLHGELPKVDLLTMEPIQCPKGSMVVFGGETIHASARNCSAFKRHAYVFHLVDDESVWNRRNWLSPFCSRLAL